MIVKNESKIIERCLDRCRDVVDYVSILDTGSDDNTPQVIESWCHSNNIVGKVHSEKFVNFGVSRTRSVELAKETFPDADYLLLIDADFCLVVEPDFISDKQHLVEDSYLFEQRHGGLRYWNTRLISTKYTWRCVGVTHEYWESEAQTERTKLHSLWIDDRGDGGCKADKFTRDRRLLKAGIKDKNTPQDLRVRYMFYLGETLRNMQKYEEAIEWYSNRAQGGGWDEEVYYAKYRIGTCYECLGEHQLALASYLEAWNHRPSRVEALYAACAMCRKQGKNHLSYMFGMQIKNTPPSSDLLFVEQSIHDYLVDYELSITSYYVNNKEQGRMLIDNLLSRSDVPNYIRDSCLRNRKHYL